MSFDHESLTEEQKMLLLGLGIPALMEIRLLALDGAEATLPELGKAGGPGTGKGCSLARTHTVLRGTLYGYAVGRFLLQRGLLERVHGETCPHVRVTEWGQALVMGTIKNTAKWHI